MDGTTEIHVSPQRRKDPAREAVVADQLKATAELSDALSVAAGFADSDVKIICHQVPSAGPSAGKWAVIRTLAPNFNFEELIDGLRMEYGPGDYGLSFMVKGQLATRKLFSIAAPKAPPVLAAPAQMGGGNEVTLQLARMQQDAADKQMQMLIAMMADSRAAAMESNKAIIGMFSVIIPALAGGHATPPDPAALIASLAATMRSLKPDAPPAPAAGQSPKEWLETLAALKELTDSGGGGGEGGGFMDLIGKAIPLLTEAVKANMGQGMGQAPAFAALPAPATLDTGDHAAGSQVPDTPGHRIIAMIAPDVVFLLNRGHDTDLAADFLADVLEEKGVGADDLQAVFAEFQAAGDRWPGELAKHGITLTSDAQVQWVFSVVTGVAKLLAESGVPEPVHPPAGQGGGDPDPKLDGGPGPKRQPKRPGPK